MTRARDLANIADGDFAGTWTVDSLASDGNVSIANGDLTITSTDAASTTPSPVLTLARDGASPEDNDVMGQIVFKMDDDAGNLSTFARMEVVATDVSNGSEDARIDFIAAKDDSFSAALSIAGQNVGIGTTSPSVLLDLESTAPTIKFTDSDATGTPECEISGAGGDLIFRADKDNEKGSSLVAFEVDGSEKMRIDSSGNVGIGTSSMGYPSFADNLTIADSGNSGITIRSGNANEGAIYFSDDTGTSAGTYAGYVVYNHSSNIMRFATGSTDRMRIDSNGQIGVSGSTTSFDTTGAVNGLQLYYETDSGLATIGSYGGSTGSTALTFHTNSGTSASEEHMRINSDGHLLIGKTADDNTTTGTAIHDNGFMSISRDANIAMLLDRTSTDGSILRFTKAGTEVGNIGTLGGDTLTVGSGDTGLLMNQTNDEIIPWNVSSNAARDGLIDLGDASHRFKDFYLSGGVYVGGTGSANFLDDYEEGTFDVTLTTTGGSVTLNSVYNTMSYTKVGRLVTVFGLIITSGVSSPTGAYAHFDTLPFTSANLTEGAGRSGGGVFYWDGANAHVKPWEISEGATRLTVYIDASTLTSGDDFYFSCTYQAA